MGVEYGFYIDKWDEKERTWVHVPIPNDRPIMIGKSCYRQLRDWIVDNCVGHVNSNDYYPFDEFDENWKMDDAIISLRAVANKAKEEWEVAIWTNPNYVKLYNNGEYYYVHETDKDDPLGVDYRYCPHDGIVAPAKELVGRIDALMDWYDIYNMDDVRIRVRDYP